MPSGTCKNCGGDYGIHHYLTRQCPYGGREAPLNQKQEYMTTNFEAISVEDEVIRMLKERILKLEEALLPFAKMKGVYRFDDDDLSILTDPAYPYPVLTLGDIRKAAKVLNEGGGKRTKRV